MLTSLGAIGLGARGIGGRPQSAATRPAPETNVAGNTRPRHIHPVLARYDKIIGDHRPVLTALEESGSPSLFSLLYFLCTLYHVPYTVYLIPCTCYYVPYTMYLILCTLYHVPYTMYLILCTLNMYLIPCTLCYVPCTLLLCTLCSTPCALYPISIPCTLHPAPYIPYFILHAPNPVS
jgi:hypothetical protein